MYVCMYVCMHIYIYVYIYIYSIARSRYRGQFSKVQSRNMLLLLQSQHPLQEVVYNISLPIMAYWVDRCTDTSHVVPLIRIHIRGTFMQRFSRRSFTAMSTSASRSTPISILCVYFRLYDDDDDDDDYYYYCYYYYSSSSSSSS